MMKLFDRLDVKNHGYKVNLWITRGAFLVLFLLMGVIYSFDGGVEGLSSYWVECPADSVDPCLNPFYDPVCEIVKPVGDDFRCGVSLLVINLLFWLGLFGGLLYWWF
jgi:hypothetical protein